MTPPNAQSRAAQIRSSFVKLSEAAFSLNHASDQLGQAVTTLEGALENLNIGVTATVTVNAWEDENDPVLVTEERLGYYKVGHKKGIVLSVVKVNNWDDPACSEFTEKEWLFNDAPRDLRLKAVEFFPLLLDTLTQESVNTTKKVKEKAELAIELANALPGIFTTSSKSESGGR